MRIDIDQSPEDEQWYVKFVASNGEHQFMSEGYVSDDNALRAVRDFFADLGQSGFIKDGVVGFNLEITVTDRDNNKRSVHDGSEGG